MRVDERLKTVQTEKKQRVGRARNKVLSARFKFNLDATNFSHAASQHPPFASGPRFTLANYTVDATIRPGPETLQGKK